MTLEGHANSPRPENEVPTFSWDNFETFAPLLIGESLAPDWIIESPLGKSISYSVPEGQGSGRIEFFELHPDLRIVIFDCFWREDRSILVDDGDSIRFNFSLSISLEMQFADVLTVEAKDPSWRIINSAPGLHARESYAGGERATWVTVSCSQRLLSRLSGVSADDLPHPLRSPPGRPQKRSLYENYEINERFNGILVDILSSRLAGGLRLAYTRARAEELVCLALDHVINPAPHAIPVKLSAADLSALEKAHRILLRDFASPPSVKELSRTIGINRNKLYYGFKSVYGMSLADFIQEQRLLEGARQLRSSELSINDIAADVGFRHQCNFSTAIKRRFGVSPKQMRERKGQGA